MAVTFFPPWFCDIFNSWSVIFARNIYIHDFKEEKIKRGCVILADRMLSAKTAKIRRPRIKPGIQY